MQLAPLNLGGEIASQLHFFEHQAREVNVDGGCRVATECKIARCAPLKKRGNGEQSKTIVRIAALFVAHVITCKACKLL